MSSLTAALTASKAKGKLRSKKTLPKSRPSPAKAAEILHDGTAKGKPLTEKQRRFFGYLSAS